VLHLHVAFANISENDNTLTQNASVQVYMCTEYETNPIVIIIKAMLKEYPYGISRTSSELLCDISKYANILEESTPTSLGKKIINLSHLLYHYDNIKHEYKRRVHTFKYV